MNKYILVSSILESIDYDKETTDQRRKREMLTGALSTGVGATVGGIGTHAGIKKLTKHSDDIVDTVMSKTANSVEQNIKNLPVKYRFTKYVNNIVAKIAKHAIINQGGKLTKDEVQAIIVKLKGPALAAGITVSTLTGLVIGGLKIHIQRNKKLKKLEKK